MDTNNYSIVFDNIEDFNKACVAEVLSELVPDSLNKGDLEMFWDQEWYRNYAVNKLSLMGIEVHTYNYDYESGAITDYV